MAAPRKTVWSRVILLVRPIFQSDLAWTAWGCLALLLGLALGVSGLNVVNSYVGRDFMSSLEERHRATFVRMTFLYLGVFAASTVVAVFYRFTEQRLGLMWRRWLAEHLVQKYLTRHTYFRLNSNHEIDNPDQRISEDVKTFTATMLSILLMLLNSTLAFLAFAGVLWSISPWLALASLGYSALGCLMTVVLGHRLVGLNNDQFRKEADFRYELINVREHAYPVALAGLEERERKRLITRLQALVDNFKSIVAVDRNIGFFISGYNYLTPIIPVLVVAPLYIRGDIKFGVVTQAAMAFAQVTNALTLIVSQIDSLSAFAAVIARLGSFWEAIDALPGPSETAITVDEDRKDPHIAFEDLTLESPDGKVLLKQFTANVGHGKRLLIVGPNGPAKDALFRATAGLWDSGSGKIVRPRRHAILFLSQQSHPMTGPLRDAILNACRGCNAPDETLLAALETVRLTSMVEGVGGLDAERDWMNSLSIGDQQRLALAGMIAADPPFAFLHGATNALGPDGAEEIYKILARTSIAYLSIEDYPHLGPYHDHSLNILEDGSWTLEPTGRPPAETADSANGHAVIS